VSLAFPFAFHYKSARATLLTAKAKQPSHDLQSDRLVFSNIYSLLPFGPYFKAIDCVTATNNSSILNLADHVHLNISKAGLLFLSRNSIAPILK
jgi:hypothetical protein